MDITISTFDNSKRDVYTMEDIEFNGSQYIELKLKNKNGTEKNLRLRVIREINEPWPFKLNIKVFPGEYPTAILLDKVYGYLFFAYKSLAELSMFATLTPEEVEEIKNSLNEYDPYAIKIKERAMFDVLCGTESYLYLKDHIYIEFNTFHKLIVERRL